MTASTAPSEAAEMRVIARVAGATGPRDLDLPLTRCRMACVARESFVRAIKHEVGLGIVVESPKPPAIGVVT